MCPSPSRWKAGTKKIENVDLKAEVRDSPLPRDGSRAPPLSVMPSAWRRPPPTGGACSQGAFSWRGASASASALPLLPASFSSMRPDRSLQGWQEAPVRSPRGHHAVQVHRYSLPPAGRPLQHDRQGDVSHLAPQVRSIPVVAAKAFPGAFQHVRHKAGRSAARWPGCSPLARASCRISSRSLVRTQ